MLNYQIKNCGLQETYKAINKKQILNARLIEIQKLFAFYGFLKTPLSQRQIFQLIKQGYSNDEIYNFGCDIAGDFGKC